MAPTSLVTSTATSEATAIDTGEGADHIFNEKTEGEVRTSYNFV